MSKPNGTYIYKNFWCTAGGYATDGERECSANGFVGAARWLAEECGLPPAGTVALWEQRELDGALS
jgi:hypothetical protein